MEPESARKRHVSDTDGNPRQKRKVTRACDICKAKKVKCSGTQPCDNCARKGCNCLYEALYTRGEPPTVPASLNLHLRPASGNESMRATHSPAIHAPNVPSRASPELEISGQYSDNTSGLSFLHRAWTRLSNSHSNPSASGTLEASQSEQLLVSAGDKPFQRRLEGLRIPPLSECLDLLTMYFDICIATYRILHRPTVEVWTETVVKNSQQGLPFSHGITQAQASTVFAVLAIASFHKAKTQGSDSSSGGDEALLESDLIFSESIYLVETETGYPRLESAQARLIQVLYLLTSSRMNQAWYTFGHTLFIISALGLHRSGHGRRQPLQRDFIEEQCQKRTFWVAYILDKYLGALFGRPRHYHDDDIDQDFPDPINDEDMAASGPRKPDIDATDDCHINSLIYHAKLAQITERILREVYSIRHNPDPARVAASHRLGLELRQWKSSLPPILGAVDPFCLIPAFSRQATVLKLSYCHAVMLAHRPLLLKNVSRQTEDVQNLASEGINECIEAAKSVLVIVDRIVKDGQIFHAFWWTHYIAFCALVVVYVWSIQRNSDCSTIDNLHADILERAEKCLKHLAQATAYNSPSRRYSIILQELRSEAERKAARRLQAELQPTNVVEGESSQGSTSIMANILNLPTAHWNSLLHSPDDSAGSQVANFPENWQTTDWLDLDASAFGPFSSLDDRSANWTGGMGQIL